MYHVLMRHNLTMLPLFQLRASQGFALPSLKDTSWAALAALTLSDAHPPATAHSLQLCEAGLHTVIDDAEATTDWTRAWRTLMWSFGLAGLYSLVASQVGGL